MEKNKEDTPFEKGVSVYMKKIINIFYLNVMFAWR